MHCVEQGGFRHSFAIRHSCFVILILFRLRNLNPRGYLETRVQPDHAWQRERGKQRRWSQRIILADGSRQIASDATRLSHPLSQGGTFFDTI
jgi:hypothetical protein